MNWCKPHWQKLKDAIKERGLWDLVGNGAADAAAAFQGQRFDPLINAWGAINHYMAQSRACRGRILECPCCILVGDGQPELVDRWIGGATDDQRASAIERGLIKTQ